MANSTSKGNTLSFLAPYPIAECHRRLKASSEPQVRFTMRDDFRLHIETWPLFGGKIGFRLLYIDIHRKQPYWWDIQSVFRVVGTLQPQDEQTTLVRIQFQKNYVQILILMLATLGILGWALLSTFSTQIGVGVLSLILAGFLAIILFFELTQNKERDEYFQIVQQALMAETPES